MFMCSAIYSNDMAVMMAKKISSLVEQNQPYELKIVKGIDGEDVVKLSWKFMEDDEEA